MEIDAFIFIGGRSSRFGSDKAAAELDGISLLDRTAETVRKAVVSGTLTVVAADESQRRDHANSNLPFIFDRYKNRGPLGGIHSALINARTDWLFVVACDYPFLCAELITFLAESITPDIDAVVPIQPDGRAQPLVAFYRVATVLEVVENLIDGDKKSPPASRIFDEIRVRFVPFDNISHLPYAGELFHNMNTPDDLDLANQMLRSRAPI